MDWSAFLTVYVWMCYLNLSLLVCLFPKAYAVIKQVYWFFRVNTFLLSLNCFSGLKPADAPKYLPLRNDFKLLWLKSRKDKHVEINKSINGDWMKLEGMFIKSWLKILFTFFLLSLYKLFFWLYDTSLKMMIVGGAW